MHRLLALLLFMVVVSQATINFAVPYQVPAAQDSSMRTPDRIDPFARETDIGRWSLPLAELLNRTYDVSGQKSEWILGTSILGNPDLDPFAMGLAQVSRRYPTMLSGLYTTRLSYDATTLTLNGENGILFEERHGIPVDTPITDLNWERGTFDGNALRLEFRRLVTDSVTLDFGLASHSNKLSKEYEYQAVTHSPYFSLGRDSTQIPFGGRNIALNTMHFQPLLTYRFGFGKLFAKMNFVSIENADNTTHKVLLDTLDHAVRTFQTDPYIIDIQTRTYGAGLELYPTHKLTFGADIQYGTHEITEDSLPKFIDTILVQVDSLNRQKRDSSFYDTTKTVEYETILGNFGIQYRTFLNPAIRFRYEFLNATAHAHKTRREHFQDREVGFFEFSDTLGPAFFRIQNGAQRNSSLLDSVDYKSAYSFDGTLRLPYHLRLNVTARHDNKFPEIDQLMFNETGRFAFGNRDLQAEIRDRHTVNLGWTSKEVFYGIGFRHEKIENMIRQRWTKGIATPEASMDSSRVDSSLTPLIYSARDSVLKAFQWINAGNAETMDWMFQIGLRLGNWRFFLERGQVLDRDYKLIDAMNLYYKGSIHWQNRFVKDRMGVSVRVDWQWFDKRYDCTINEDGLPELAELKKYLALDFEARMQILTFEIYSRIENFNHSIYMPASGYTPEGLRFAYGIVWTFGN